jgi:hypothetical protein
MKEKILFNCNDSEVVSCKSVIFPDSNDIIVLYKDILFSEYLKLNKILYYTDIFGKNKKQNLPYILLGENIYSYISENLFITNFANDYVRTHTPDANDIIHLIYDVDFFTTSINPNIDVSQKISTTSKMTYMMVDSLGYIKIGRSYSPVFRERTLRSEIPDVILFATNVNDIEKKLHKEYSDFRKRGEWFKLSKEQVLRIIKLYNFDIYDEDVLKDNNQAIRIGINKALSD